MKTVAGIVLVLAAGGLGYMAWDAYREHNRLANDFNDALKGSPIRVEMKRETPPRTLWGGIGAAVCMLTGVALIAKK